LLNHGGISITTINWIYRTHQNNATELDKPQEILKTFPKAGVLACRQTLVTHPPLK
jgi:hypothetical protein